MAYSCVCMCMWCGMCVAAAETAGTFASAVRKSDDKCDAALQRVCGTVNYDAVPPGTPPGMFPMPSDCSKCAGAHQQPLRAAGCTDVQIRTWCADPFAGSFLLNGILNEVPQGSNRAWVTALNTWFGNTTQKWTRCCGGGPVAATKWFNRNLTCNTADAFHALCDAHNQTLIVLHNAGGDFFGRTNPGNFTFGGFVRSYPAWLC
eukprot:COSAG02_NODE_201_length_29473_cov_135.510213_9_plen_204_part_00